ncbi:MAG: type II toxin-antitoxin system RelE/ParE family toxin [Opitutales bacterium]
MASRSPTLIPADERPKAIKPAVFRRARRNRDRVDQLYRKGLQIAELEAVGRNRDELFPGLLSLAYKKYVIFILRSNGRVEIVRILRGSRDHPQYFSH